jgi:hypothetical protein
MDIVHTIGGWALPGLLGWLQAKSDRLGLQLHGISKLVTGAAAFRGYDAATYSEPPRDAPFTLNLFHGVNQPLSTFDIPHQFLFPAMCAERGWGAGLAGKGGDRVRA